MLLEVCVDSVESAQNAIDGGADRLELCSSLSEAGLTPSLGLFQAVKKITQNTKVEIFCMIRIRGGNFCYTSDEILAMCVDVKYFRSNGADGIVFGALTATFEIDVESCRQILSAWNCQKPATFHRAFDETKVEEIEKNVKIISNLGFKRILTSGLEATAEKGIENLKKIVKAAKVFDLKILPGAGVTKANVEMILKATGCEEVHASARSEKNIATRLSLGGEKVMICDRKKVQEIVGILKGIWKL